MSDFGTTFIEAWGKEIWPVIKDKFESLSAARPKNQNENAIGVHYGTKAREVCAENKEVRNVTCNLAWWQ